MTLDGEGIEITTFIDPSCLRASGCRRAQSDRWISNLLTYPY